LVFYTYRVEKEKGRWLAAFFFWGEKAGLTAPFLFEAQFHGLKAVASVVVPLARHPPRIRFR
jgi:hypothetical protein